MRLLFRILSRLSLQQLYHLSDYVLFPLMYYVIRYRRKVVRCNITGSFPAKSREEKQLLEQQFYHHLADLFAEIIWSYRATEEDMKQHITYDNLDELEQWAHGKQGTFVTLGHMGNWEWMPEFQHRVKDSQLRGYNVYRKQRNAEVNQLMIELRDRRTHADSCIEKNDLIRAIIRLRKAGEQAVFGLVCDQKAQPKNVYLWTQFLHRETGFLGGAEVLSRKYDMAVVYAHIVKESRGQYRVHFVLISDDAPHTPTGYITEQFARLLEANINEQPAIWLWSHNRWKWTREA